MATGEVFEYEIDGKKYIQRRLVLGQTGQLSELLAQTYFPVDGNMMGIVAALGGKLSRALAIVLIPELSGLDESMSLQTSSGLKHALRSKDIDKLAKEFDYAVETDMQALAMEVVDHFLECNHISSIFDKMGEMMDNATEKMKTVRGKMQAG